MKLVKSEVDSCLEQNSLLLIVIYLLSEHKYKAKAWNSNNEMMKNWLCIRNILFCDTVLKVKLCEIIDANSLVPDLYLINQISHL